MNDRKALLILNMVSGIGGKTLLNSLEKIGSPEKLLLADEKTLISLKTLNKKTISNIIAMKNDLSPVEKEIREIKENNIHIVTIIDEDYPPYLKEISSPPIILYLKGSRDVLQKRKISVVGSRRCSSYGIKNTRKLCESLSIYRDLCIVSGLAEGIDTAAHRGALDNNGFCLAVLGHGLKHLYPESNKKLAKQIIETGGALISEFPLNTPPKKENFPKRNRIISGLSECIVVTEAAKRSGALITANMALDQGRCVCSMPGKIDSFTSAGTNELIRQGAKIVTTPEDVLEEMMITTETKTSFAEDKEQNLNSKNLSPEEKHLMKHLDDDPLHLDIISEKTGVSVSALPAMLLNLEIKNIIAVHPGNKYSLK